MYVLDPDTGQVKLLSIKGDASHGFDILAASLQIILELFDETAARVYIIEPISNRGGGDPFGIEAYGSVSIPSWITLEGKIICIGNCSNTATDSVKSSSTEVLNKQFLPGFHRIIGIQAR